MTLITQIFQGSQHAREAVVELQSKGINSGDISFVSRDTEQMEKIKDIAEAGTTGAGIGAALGGAGGLLAGLGLLAVPGIGPVVAAGWLASTAAGVATGAAAGAVTGGIVGALQDEGLTAEEAESYSERIRNGGTLVCVKTDESMKRTVENVLSRHHAMETTSSV